MFEQSLYFRSEDTYEDQRSSIGSPSSVTTKEEKESPSEEFMDIIENRKGKYVLILLGIKEDCFIN